MTAATFRAHCAKGHDRIDFQGEDGAKAFEAHMKGEHKRTPYASKVRPASKPHPWTASPVPKDWETRLAATLTAYGDDVIEADGLKVPDGTYRFDNGAEPPYRALPPNVRSILEAVVSRGELWAVVVKGDSAALSFGRAVNDQAVLKVWRGKVQPRSTRLRRPQDTHGMFSPKLSDVRAAFGPDWTPAASELAS